MKHSRVAFTLIELLVVVAIISILAAILFPVFARAKTAALQTQSVSNMRQIGLAWTLYNGSYDEVMMPPRSWMGGTQFAYWWAGFDHGTNVQDERLGLLCPYTKGAGVQSDPLWPDRLRIATGFTGYGYNYSYLGNGKTSSVAVQAPSETVAFATSARIDFLPPYALQGNTYLEPPSHDYPTFHHRANGNGVILWTDGHVTTRRPHLRAPADIAGQWQSYSVVGLGEIDRDGDLTTDELFDLIDE